MKTFYVTTPIYYANSLPHLGHLYTMIVADTIARSKRQQGIETFFLTGTDEHGINIERAAQKNNRTPQEQADYVVSYFKKMTAALVERNKVSDRATDDPLLIHHRRPPTSRQQD